MCEEVKQFLTNEVCKNLIAKKLNTNEFKLINTTIKPLSDTPQGFSGTHYFLQFEIIPHNNELNQIVKFFLKFKFDSVGKKLLFSDENDVYITETKFLELVTTYNVEWAPKFYGYIEERLLVLEDLSERGFQLHHGSFEMNHCFVALTNLAKFHTFSFQYIHDQKQLNSNYSILKEYPEFFIEVAMQLETKTGKEWFAATIDCINMILDEMSPSNSKIKDIVHEKYKDMYEYLKAKDSPYNAISHGDLWSNNLLFSYENDVPQKCCFIDFQVIRFLPPVHDILMLLHLNTSIEFRRQLNFQQLFNYYYQQLTDELNKVGLDANVVYPIDVFQSSINNSILPVLLLNCMYKTFTLMNRGQMGTYTTDYGEEFWFHDRKKFVKHELDTDETYKRGVFEEFQICIDEIVKLL